MQHGTCRHACQWKAAAAAAAAAAAGTAAAWSSIRCLAARKTHISSAAVTAAAQCFFDQRRVDVDGLHQLRCSASDNAGCDQYERDSGGVLEIR
jgi:hypothetical protein